jgi:subtilisin family serine protease
MPSDERNSDVPGRGTPSGPPGDADDRAEPQLAAQIQRQVTELAQRRYEPAVRHELLRQLAERRAAGSRTPVARFDYLPAHIGYDSLQVSGELLISQQSYAEARPYLTALDLVPTGLDHRQLASEQQDAETLAARVVVLKRQNRQGAPIPTSAQELADIARNLRLRGFSASVTPVAATAPVTKGQGGPRPAAPGAMATLGRKGPQVAIIDTGISRQRAGTVLPGSTLDVLHQFPLGNSSQARAERRAYLSFDAGHGTFVTGIVQQLAPDAAIKVYRAVDSDGFGTDPAVASRMIQAVREGAEIINLSLGCQTQDDFPPVAMSAAMDWIRDWEKDHHPVLIVAAAGNYGDTRPSWPAAFRGVVSVAGLAPDMLPSQWSSRGFWVTCSTIAQGVRSTFVEGTESPLLTPAPVPGAPPSTVSFHGNPPWAVWSGTSFAAPQITGRLAQLYPASQPTLRGALQQILSAGRPLPDFGQAVRILGGI